MAVFLTKAHRRILLIVVVVLIIIFQSGLFFHVHREKPTKTALSKQLQQPQIPRVDVKTAPPVTPADHQLATKQHDIAQNELIVTKGDYDTGASAKQRQHDATGESAAKTAAREGDGSLDSSQAQHGSNGIHAKIAKSLQPFTSHEGQLHSIRLFEGATGLSQAMSMERQSTEQLSLDAWVYLETLPSKDTEWCIISQGSWDDRFKLSISSTGQVLITLHLQNGVRDFPTRYQLNVNSWYHIAVTFRSDPHNQVKVYINGLEQELMYYGKWQFLPLMQTNREITVGKCLPGDSVLFRGNIANARVWNKQLQHFEVIRAMQHGDEQLVKYWYKQSNGPVAIISRNQDESIGKLVDTKIKPELIPFPARLSYGFVTEAPAGSKRMQKPLASLDIVVPVGSQSQHLALSNLLAILMDSKVRPVSSLVADKVRLFVIETKEGAISQSHLNDATNAALPRLYRDTRVETFLVPFDEKQFEGSSKSHAMNYVIKNKVKSEWAFILDPHVQPAPYSLRFLLNRAREAPASTAIIVPRLIYPQGDILHAGYEFRMADVVDSDEPLPFYRLRGVPFGYAQSLVTGKLDSAEQFFVLIKRSSIVDAGGWDSKMEPQFQNVDLSLRLRHAGQQLIYAPESIAFFVQHKQSALAADVDSDESSAFVVPDWNEKLLYESVTSDMIEFLSKWRQDLKQQIQDKWQVSMRTKWIMHCGGSQGFEAAGFLTGLEPKLPIRVHTRRYHYCDSLDTIGHLPISMQEAVERSRLRSFYKEGGDQVVVYHRDYRELGLWLGVNRTIHQYQVGRYMFETDGLHPQWIEQMTHLDEIWVPASFHVDIFSKQGVPKEKIHIVPEAVDTDLLDPRIIEPLHLPGQRSWVFLSVFRMQERKGWKELLSAYVQEFSNQDDVSLFIHTSLDSLPGDKFSADGIEAVMSAYLKDEGLLKDNMPHWKVVGRYLTSPELLRLYRAADAFVLPTHGEGWGLPLHEAMSFGLPVIGTAWSGNTEFMKNDVAYLVDVEKLTPSDPSDAWFAGHNWAQPSIPHLQKQMRKVFSNQDQARKVGEAARKHIIERFSVQPVANIILQQLERIQKTVKFPILDPPASQRTVDRSIAVGIENDVKMCLAVGDDSRPVRRERKFLGKATRTNATKDKEWTPLRLSQESGANDVESSSQKVASLPGRRIVLISTWLPRKCGIATFGGNTVKAMNAIKKEGDTFEVIPMVIDLANDKYDPEMVKMVIRRDNIEDYYRAAHYINSGRFDLLMVQHEFGIFGGTAGAFITCLTGMVKIPIVTTVHTIKENMANEEMAVLQQLAFDSNSIVVMSMLAKRMLDVFQALDTPKIKIIPHGVPEIPFVEDSNTMKPEFGWEGRFVLLNNGIQGEGKGLEYIIEAVPKIVEQVPEFLFVVAGEVSPTCGKACVVYMEKIHSRVQALGIEKHVQFKKQFFPEKQIYKLLQASDIFITAYPDPSVTNSGTVSMAMSAGRPVISTPFTFSRTTLLFGRGVLVKFKDSTSISNAVIKLHKDPTLRKKIGKTAFEFAKQAWWPLIAEQYWNLFDEVMH